MFSEILRTYVLLCIIMFANFGLGENRLFFSVCLCHGHFDIGMPMKFSFISPFLPASSFFVSAILLTPFKQHPFCSRCWGMMEAPTLVGMSDSPWVYLTLTSCVFVHCPQVSSSCIVCHYLCYFPVAYLIPEFTFKSYT